MQYPEVLIIPVLMFLDYYLTIWGAIQRTKAHSKYILIENYELNPMWQNDIKQRKLFNIKQIVLTIAFFIFLIYVFEFYDLSVWYKEGLFGFLLIHNGMLVGRHVSNILTYNYVEKNSDSLNGQIKLSHQFSLHHSQYQYFVVIVPMVAIAILNPKPFTIGCAVGALNSIIYHKLWIRKFKKRKTSV